MKNQKNYKSILMCIGGASLLICNSVKAQSLDFEWAKKTNTNITVSSKIELKVDFNGDIYQTGIFNGTTDFDPGIGVFNLTATSSDLYISKLDNQGNFLWAKQFTGTGNEQATGLHVDETGSLIVSGVFTGVTDFDPGVGTFNMSTLPVFNKYNTFVLKLDELGNFEWAKKIKGSESNGSTSVITDISGNIYVTGLFSGTADFNPGSGTTNLVGQPQDFFLLKLNGEGEFIWVKELNGPFYDFTKLDFDLLGNIYISGNYYTTIDFDPGAGVFNLTANFVSDIFILKLDPSGEFIWAKSIGGNSYDEFRSITIDDSGNIYTAGKYRGTADFDPSESIFNLTSSGSNNYDIFISKLNADGNFEWAKSFGNTFDEEASSIKADQLGNIYLSGTFIGTVDFDPSIAVFNLISRGIDVYILKLNSNGDIQWVGKLGGNSNDFAFSSDIDSFGNIYTAGAFSGTADFDPSIGKSKLTATGAVDSFIQKMSQDIPENNLQIFQEEVITSLDIAKNTFIVFPNPAKGSFNINTDLENYNVELRDVTGKLVYTQNNINQTTFNLEIKHIEAGTYFVQISNQNSKEVIKLMVY